MIDSFGFRVMSLREVIADLTKIGDNAPALLDMPVWTANMNPVHFPVKEVRASPKGTHLTFERGGN